MEKYEKALAEHPFFHGLDPGLIRMIAPYASQVRYDAGQMIYREGDEASQFLLIRHGKVSIEIHAGARGSHTIQTVGPDEVLGWSWLFPPYRRRFDARALELTRGIALDGKRLREKAAADHRLGYELLVRFSRVVVERLQAASHQLLDMYGKRA